MAPLTHLPRLDIRGDLTRIRCTLKLSYGASIMDAWCQQKTPSHRAACGVPSTTLRHTPHCRTNTITYPDIARCWRIHPFFESAIPSDESSKNIS